MLPKALQFVFFGITILLYSCQTLFCTLYSKHFQGKEECSTPLFSTVSKLSTLLLTVALIFITGGTLKFSPITAIFAVINVIFAYLYDFSMIKAGKKGSYAFMCISYLTGGLIVPVAYDCIKNTLLPDVLKIVGFFGVIAAVVLMNIEDVKLKNTPIAYYLFCALLFISNGAYGLVLKLQSDFKPEESMQMIVIMTGVMGLYMLFTLLRETKKSEKGALKIGGKALASLILCVLSAAGALNVTMFIMPRVDLTVYLSIEGGGVMILSMLFSVIIFKDKLSPVKIIGMVVALLAIFALSIA